MSEKWPLTIRLLVNGCLLLLLAAIGAAIVWTSLKERVDEGAAPSRLILATTTSTYDSGLLDHILPDFEARTSIPVEVVAVGTGQALEMGRNGDADVLLVHAPALEEEFVAAGHGVNRQPVMYNDFVVVGPGPGSAAWATSRAPLPASPMCSPPLSPGGTIREPTPRSGRYGRRRGSCPAANGTSRPGRGWGRS